MRVAQIGHEQRGRAREREASFPNRPAPREQNQPEEGKWREQRADVRAIDIPERALGDRRQTSPRLARYPRQGVILVEVTELLRELAHHRRELPAWWRRVETEAWSIPWHVLARPHVPGHRAPVAGDLCVAHEQDANYPRAHGSGRRNPAPVPRTMT